MEVNGNNVNYCLINGVYSIGVIYLLFCSIKNKIQNENYRIINTVIIVISV